MGKNLKAESRLEWASNLTHTSYDQLKIGCLQRIADATEMMAKNYSEIIESRNTFKRFYEEGKGACIRLQRSNAALRGVITKLKNRTGRME